MIYKALHKGDVNYRVTVLDSSFCCADSRAVTKQGLFDCEPVSLITAFINENKCIALARVPAEVIDENYGIHDV